MSDRFPVFVSVTRDDGRTEQVRVGSALKTGDGFTIAFDTMTIGSTPMSAAPRAAASRQQSSAPSRAPAGGGDGMLLPNYGRSKGMPVSGASLQDLEFYANGARRSLADPSKSRWHDKERQLLAAIEAEIARQRGEEPSSSSSSGAFGDEPPPPGDDDAPF
jgi:hypothetical protein